MKILRFVCAAFGILGGSVVGQSPARASATLSEGMEMAFLDVASDPPAHILIDDTDTGKTTPQSRLVLSAGHHVLTLITSDGAHKRTIGFTVNAGQTKTFKIHFAS